MEYEIKGGAFPVVICHLKKGEKMITEKGAMVWMSPCMEMETKGGGLGKMFSKAFAGEPHSSCTSCILFSKKIFQKHLSVP